jgi:phosphoglycolate phosphatase-like HAD superfamily hydrolase
MERLGLADLFAPDTGAYGCERENRVELFALARKRAGGWPPEATVAVGDTPLDVSTAHAAGVHSVAVTTGAYGEGALADAEAVIPDLAELASAITSLE